MWRFIVSIILLTQCSICWAGNPPTILKDEGVEVGTPAYVIDCVGDNITCTHSGITGTITVSGVTSEVDPSFNTWISTTPPLYSFTESDPVYSVSSWASTTNNATDWDTAYGWGDHSLVGYLTSESDPLSLKLDQTTPQTFTNLGGGTGLMKVTSGVLGLDTNTYLTTSGGLIKSVTTVTDTYTILSTDFTVVCNKATDFTVTLPTAVVGQVFNVKNIGAGDVTIDGAGSDTIDGSADYPLSQWGSVTVQCIASNTWVVI